jgi:hypothetical protein
VRIWLAMIFDEIYEQLPNETIFNDFIKENMKSFNGIIASTGDECSLFQLFNYNDKKINV